MRNLIQSSAGVGMLLCLVLALAPGQVWAQAYQQWVATYDGPSHEYDQAASITVDAAGNVYVTGSSGGPGMNQDYTTIKYNSAGVEQWIAIYDGPAHGEDEACAVAVEAMGNVYVTGTSPDSGTGSDYATIKYDPNGVEQWVIRYNDPSGSSDVAAALALDAEANVYVTGTSAIYWGASPPPKVDADYATVKYSSAGVEQWVARYNSAPRCSDAAQAIALGADGYVYVTGISSDEEMNSDFATIKYDALTGAEHWVARYDGPAHEADYAKAIGVDDNGCVYVTGNSESTEADWDYATIKYDSNGTLLWVVRYNGLGNESDVANDLGVDSEGNVFVTGTSWGIWTQSDYATIKYSPDGQELWEARYDGPANWGDGASALALDAEGNVYVAGSSFGIGTNNDYATVKYNSEGEAQWVARYDSPNNSEFDEPASLAVDAAENVYVTGHCLNEESQFDFTTIKYTPSFDPCVAVTLIPFSSPIQIPASGGSFDFTLFAANNAADPQVSSLWIEAIPPPWTGHVLLLGPVSVTLNPGTTGWYRVQTVPASAPAGLYHYVAHSGIYPSLAWESDTLEIVKLTTGDGEWVGDWSNTGESFEIANDKFTIHHSSFIISADPNPFNPSTAISFELRAASFVKLAVYDISGRLVATLVDGWRDAGVHQIIVDGSGLPSGIYFAKLRAGDYGQVQKLVLMK